MRTPRRSVFWATTAALALGCNADPYAGEPVAAGFVRTADPACDGGRTRCDDRCVDVSRDRGHCGACGVRCGLAETCRAGACVIACREGERACVDPGGTMRCADLAGDPQHCGACGNACGPSTRCSNGACVDRCADDEHECLALGEGDPAPMCARLDRDPRNCGTCGRECGPEEVCAAGQCHPRCDAGETACAGPTSGGVERCVDTSRDPEHCGACGVRCGYGELCDNGRCGVRCGVGFTACQGACVDVRWDPAHCGACGYRCGAHQACAEGRCIAFCPNDFLDCDGVCRDASNDRAHCGACDRACAEGEGCFEGRCVARGAP